ncbi:MAG: class I SAM-dependent methyltransferase [Anaerolineales bacterium]|nr:class I SAM-dependent methyltransferase [Anaerolineales bacterium]
MTLAAQQWHRRYQQQARWTHDLRAYLFPRAGLQTARRVLEVGCGSGVLLAEIQQTDLHCHGVDLEQAILHIAQQYAPQATLLQANGFSLPYQDACFDLVFCHFLLLWVHQPEAILREMCRVTRPEGTILALAEPDYGGRIDFPTELAAIGQLQAQALFAQGADPQMGRKLSALFHQAGLADVEVGVLGGQWKEDPDWQAWELEWQVLVNDLRGLGVRDQGQIQKLRELDRRAWKQGERVLYVPTFYAWGRIPR